jgi:hypothetical protein
MGVVVVVAVVVMRSMAWRRSEAAIQLALTHVVPAKGATFDVLRDSGQPVKQSIEENM